MIPPTTSPRIVYTVSQINRAARTLLESQFPALWLEGEVSNLSRPSSGHLYFSLKDAKAQIRCALFQNRSLLLRDCPRNGQQVLARGRVSLYEPRGDYQIIVDYLEEAGDGALRRAFDELRLRLEQEGWFALERKRPLPRFPRCIGVITSTTGAAIRDVLATLARRCPGLPVLIYPVSVQGEGAAEQIVRMLQLASQRQDCDVLLLVRGGGSLEDLQAFNEEAVARAIFACAVPLVTGIGHETDVTIADFAADLRAPTPTAAAELVSPDVAVWRNKIQQLDQRLQRASHRYLNERAQRLDELTGRWLRLHPRRRLRQHAQRLAEMHYRLQRSIHNRLNQERLLLAGLAARLQVQTPMVRVRQQRLRLQQCAGQLHTAMRQQTKNAVQRLHQLSGRLQALSPLATLNRGYAILRRPDQVTILRRANDVAIGETVEACLKEGCLICEIKAITMINPVTTSTINTTQRE